VVGGGWWVVGGAHGGGGGVGVVGGLCANARRNLYEMT